MLEPINKLEAKLKVNNRWKQYYFGKIGKDDVYCAESYRTKSEFTKNVPNIFRHLYRSYGELNGEPAIFFLEERVVYDSSKTYPDCYTRIPNTNLMKLYTKQDAAFGLYGEALKKKKGDT